MEQSVMCEIESCRNTAMLRWSGLLVCGPCIDAMASMNGENEEVLREVVRTASPLEGEWICRGCGAQSDSFQMLNGVCLDCRSVMPLAWVDVSPFEDGEMSLSELQAAITRMVEDSRQLVARLSDERRRVAEDAEFEAFVHQSIHLGEQDIDAYYVGKYPHVIGNGHPDVCLCYECAPHEYS